MNVIIGTAFSLTLGIWRLRVRIAVEDVMLDGACTLEGDGDRVP